MSTSPTPAIGRLNTPPAIQAAVIAGRTAGKSKRSIAKELGIARDTVDNIIEVFQADQPNYATTVRELTTKSFVRVAQAIETEKDTDTARWALEHTVFRPEQDASLHVHGDATFQAAIGLLPQPAQASTPSQPPATSSTESTRATVSSGTEAPAKLVYAEIYLECSTNFFSELSKQPAKHPITLTCDGQTMQIMRLPSGSEPAPLEGVIEVSPLPPSTEQGNAES